LRAGADEAGLSWACAANESGAKFVAFSRAMVEFAGMKLFYTGPFVNAELLVVMLAKHGISATQEFADPSLPADGDLSRPAKVFVPEADYERAHRLFYAEREDEL